MLTKSLLPKAWDVPQRFRDRLGSSVGRQRSMLAEDQLLLVLHVPPKPIDDQRTGRFFWRKSDGTWISNDLGAGLGALTKHLTEYADAVEQYDRQEEEASSAENYFAVLEGLAPLHRAARHLHQVLQDARKSVPDDRNLINLRDRAYEIERTAELLYNSAENSLEFAVAKRAEEQAKSSQHMADSAHRLNLLAAFFFPIATLSSMFGVNLRHGLEQLPPPFTFLTVMSLGLFFGFVLLLFLTNRSSK